MLNFGNMLLDSFTLTVMHTRAARRITVVMTAMKEKKKKDAIEHAMIK